jgi:hypothetical protein
MEWDRTKKRRVRKNPNTLVVSKIAKLTGFTHNAVLYWIKRKQLKAKFDGFQWQVNPTDLKKFLNHYYVDGKAGENK